MVKARRGSAAGRGRISPSHKDQKNLLPPSIGSGGNNSRKSKSNPRGAETSKSRKKEISAKRPTVDDIIG